MIERWRWRLRRPIPDLAMIAALSAGATFSSQVGSIVGDGRYEHLVAPGQFFQRHRFLWDIGRGPGEPTEFFSPVVGAMQAAFAAVGFSPWVIERLSHTVYLTIAAMGALMFMREVKPKPQWGGLVCALLYAFSPFTSQFLTPSGLFYSYALAPWFAFFVLRGLTGRGPESPWAAWTALAIFSVGTLNTATLLYAFIPAVALALYLLLTRGCTTSRFLRFASTTGALTLGVSAAMMVVTVMVAPKVALNLATTESLRAVTQNTSASETWRGLGQWLTYFSGGDRNAGTSAERYLTDPVVIAASFVPAIVALLGMVRGRPNHARALALIGGVSLLIMVGPYPQDGAGTITSDLIGQILSGEGFVRGFRTAYKAGPGLQLSIAVLAASALGELRHIRRRPVMAVTVALAAVPLALSALPFYTGGVYSRTVVVEDRPAYWDEAFEWLDQQPETDRVLVLPGMSRMVYRWGGINDTMFDGLLGPQLMMSQGLPQGTPETIDALWWLERAAHSRGFEPGPFVQQLQRLGIRWVLVQNDLSWETLDRERPADYAPLRASMRRVVAFGDAGENTAADDDVFATLLGETALPPVEILEVPAPRPTAQWTPGPPLMVSGAGDSWPALARRGLLGWPIQHVGTATNEASTTAFEQGAPLVITDGARRRALRITTNQVIFSHTLGADEETTRQVQTITEDAAEQTTASFGQLGAVRASAYGTSEQSWLVDYRPGAASDGDTTTAWAVWGFLDPVGAWWRADLAEPTDLAAVELDPYRAFGEAQRVVRATIRIESGSGTDEQVVAIPVNGRPARFAVNRDDVTAVQVTIEEVRGADRLPAGFREITLFDENGALDGVERLDTPVPPREVTEDTPVAYLFSRWIDGPDRSEYSGIRRGFTVREGGEYRFEATLRFTSETLDSVADGLLNGPVRAYANQRFRNEVIGSGMHVVDANLETAWRTDPAIPAQVELTFPSTGVDAAQVLFPPPDPTQRSTPTAVEITTSSADGARTVTRAELAAECSPTVCVAALPVSGIDLVGAAVRITEYDRGIGRDGAPLPAEILEIRLLNLGQDRASAVVRDFTATCRPWFTLDGRPLLVRPVSTPVTPFDLAVGFSVEPCEPLQLGAGQHTLASASSVASAVVDVWLRPSDWPEAPPPATAVPLTRHPDGSLDLQLPGGIDGVLSTTIPAHPGWKLTSADGIIGPRLSVDLGSAWFVTTSSSTAAHVRFFPEQIYRVAWCTTAASLVVCLWLVVPRRARRAS